MVGIPKTYWDDNPEDRRFADDFWAWLKGQPAEAWLYYARRANWDQADGIFLSMIRDPRCDRALASWLFWSADPSYFIEARQRPPSNSIIGAILDRSESTGFGESRLHYQRVEVAFNALRTAAALEKLNVPAPFRIPRELCATFDGTNLDLPAYDEETERDLAELFEYLNGTLPRTDRDSWEWQRRGGNWWYEKALQLPSEPTVTEQMSDIEGIDAVFGDHGATLARVNSARNRAAARSTFVPRKRTVVRSAILVVGGMTMFLLALFFAPKLAFPILLLLIVLGFVI